jgi:ABC-type multidrug transport system ATPase subunit
LVAVTAGEARVLDFDLRKDRRSVRRRVALLGHASFLYEDLSVEENLRFAARAAGRAAEDAEPAMTMLGLDGRLRGVPVSRLSSGQRRRVSIAGVVARQAELWLLDEPHAGLDERTRDVLDSLIKQAAAQGSTVLLASHELERAAPLATRQVAMGGGRADGRIPEPGAPRARTMSAVGP